MQLPGIGSRRRISRRWRRDDYAVEQRRHAGRRGLRHGGRHCLWKQWIEQAKAVITTVEDGNTIAPSIGEPKVLNSLLDNNLGLK
jgi:hypothetical protein